MDANVFLELELEQQKADACEEVLRRFQRGELEGVITDFAIDTIVAVMENYRKEWGEVRTFLSSLLGYRGLHIRFSRLLDKIKATNHMKRHGLDFDDALALQAMKASGINSVVSYDEDFDLIPDIERVSPEDLLRRT